MRPMTNPAAFSARPRSPRRGLLPRLLCAALLAAPAAVPSLAHAFDIGEAITAARLSGYPIDPREARVGGTPGRDGATVVGRYANLLYVYRFEGAAGQARQVLRSQPLVMPLEQLGGQPDTAQEIGLLGPFPADQSYWVEYRPRGAGSDTVQAFLVRADGSVMRVQADVAGLTLYVPVQWNDEARAQALAASRPRLPPRLEPVTRDPHKIRFVPEPAIDAPAELARLHAAVAQTDRKDRARFIAGLDAMTRLLAQVDIRAIDPGLADPATLTRLNDYGFWLAEARRPASAVAVLDEVLWRAPERRPALLNRGDAYVQLQQAATTPEARHYNLVMAQEDYRSYCGRMLAQGETIPSNIAQRLVATLGVASLDAASCVPHRTLHDAAASGDASALGRAIAQGIAPDDLDAKGLTPLAHAVMRARPATVEALLRAGARLDAVRGSPLLARALPPSNAPALTPEHYAVARLLIGAGADVEARDSDQNTLLMQRARYNNKNRATLEFLLEQGADANARNKRGESVLQAALTSADTRWLAEALVARGANVDSAYISAYYGDRPVWITPLLETLRSHPGELAPGKTPRPPANLDFLLQHGADVSVGGLGAPDKQVPRNGLEAALESAAMYASPDLISTLRAHAKAPHAPLTARPLQRVLANWNTARGRAASDPAAWQPVLAQWRATAEAMVTAGVALRDPRSTDASARGNLPPLALPWLPDELYAAWLAAGADPAERAGYEIRENHGMQWPAALPLVNMVVAGEQGKVALLLPEVAQMVRTPALCGKAVADVAAWQVALDGPLSPPQAQVQRQVLDAARAVPECDLDQTAGVAGYANSRARDLLARNGTPWP